MTRAKINCEKSVGLGLGSWKTPPLPSWTDGLCKIFSVWFGPDLQQRRIGWRHWKKIKVATELWLRKRLSLKVRVVVCGSPYFASQFLGQTCAQDDETGNFKKEDAWKAYLSLSSVHLNDGEACLMSEL